MLRFSEIPEGRAGHLKWDDDPDNTMPTYRTICTVVWTTPHDVLVLGLLGDLTRRDIRDLLAWLTGREVHRVHCRRAPGRLMPFAEPHPQWDEWLLIDIRKAVARF